MSVDPNPSDPQPRRPDGRPAPPQRRPHRHLTRADLPDELTPESLRRLDLRTLRTLSRRGNGILSPEDQLLFDRALAEMSLGTAALVEESLRRARHGGPVNLDPDLRRSYQRTQQRLAEQARRVQRSLPDLAPGPPGVPDVPDVHQLPGGPDDGAVGGGTEQPTPADQTPADQTPADQTPGDHSQDDTEPEPSDTETTDDDVSPDTLAEQVEQTSQTLDMLERIASLQQQQVEHQHTQLLSETRGFFFAFLVSVAVIIAGVAPLVDAEPHQRMLIIVWTVVVTAVAGVVYALVRAVQVRKKPDPEA